ncbi:CHAT domain-containing protein [Flavobacteriaceae bacterium TK19130]|nr:CHAT domain-containing protein [Thermobacterium salinum]
MNKRFFTLMLFMIPYIIWGQHDSLVGVSRMTELVQAKKIKEANTYLAQQLSKFKKEEKADSIAKYIEFIGSFSLNQEDWDRALERTNKWVTYILSFNDPFASKYAYKELAWVQSDAGRPDLAYLSVEKALHFAKKDSSNAPPTEDDMHYNLGYYASSMGNYVASKNHYQKSLETFNKRKEKNYVSLQQVYNALGGVMWREGKMDSCQYYFQKSLEALKKTENTPENQYYRPALVMMNMAVVSNVLGKNQEAIAYSQKAINDLNDYMVNGTDEQRISAAEASKFAAIDNLGAFHNAVGEFRKAEELIEYSYQRKLKTRNPNDPNVIISKILLAQAKLNTRDLNNALYLVEEVQQQINENPAIPEYWKGSAFTTYGKILEALKRPKEAGPAYEKGRELFLQSLGGNYNNDLLSEIANMAVFYAKNNQRKKALATAEELYSASKKSEFHKTQQGLHYILAVAETYFQLGEFEKAKSFSQEVIDAIEVPKQQQKVSPDVVLNSFQLPRAILIHAQSEYALLPAITLSKINQLSNSLTNAFEVLQLRQSFLQNYEDVRFLISQNTDLFNFAKKLQLQAYQKSKDSKYLEKLIQYHESSIYNRIRARLALREYQPSDKLPASILQQESELKAKLSSALQNSSEEGISTFIKASNEWETLRETLKTDYPDYFSLKYGSILHEKNDWKNEIPANTTLIRYLFVEDELYSLVLTNNSSTLQKHTTNKLSETIEALQQHSNTVEAYREPMYILYEQLWGTIADNVATEEVIIIPDGPLFNLSFDLLTKTPIASFKELATKGLLANHCISYEPSLYMLQNGTAEVPQERFVAFAPTFDAEMKVRYKNAQKDSTAIDKTYLTLLPQPFIREVAEKYSKLFRGTAYLNDDASKMRFLSEADQHSIIHIGTHAESNNVSPELSRLIFAKGESSETVSEENSLYAYELYNYELSSELAILTACETGKPSYQPGEGMLSLTHAFTHAGSQSILTSLWNVDEKSSAAIVAAFYDHLADGVPKNKALQLAKLEYLSQAKGRVQAPPYWAGLILMGNTEPLKMTLDHSNWILYGGILLIVIGLLFWLWRRKKA